MHVPIRCVAGTSASSAETEMSHNFDNSSAKHVATSDEGMNDEEWDVA